MKPRVGSLFSGYEGLGLALIEVFGDVEHLFVSDVCKHTKTKDGRHEVGHHEPHRAPCSILAHRFPGVPNLGDVSLIDWTPWRGRIDILTAGFPCTDVSVAGGRAGLREGTRTGLWSQVVRAITELSPRLVVLENVPGIFTAPAAGDVEPCPVCLGDGSGEHLRALDAVLGDLAAVGFDADWTVVPASGVGAAHRRERWFCTAYPAGQPWSFEHATAGWTCVPLSPTSPCCRRLPSNDMGAAYTPETWDEWTADMKAKHNNGNGHGKSLNIEAQRLSLDVERLLPTPQARDEKGYGPADLERNDPNLSALPMLLLPTPRTRADVPTSASAREKYPSGDSMGDVVAAGRWGEYGPAIRRCEALTRPAPEPTKLNAKGNPKLSDEFDEWLMMLPAGWITDVPGITWNETLKACGNGVVPQQCIAALRFLWGMSEWQVAV